MPENYQILQPLRAVSTDPTNVTKLDADNNVLTSTTDIAQTFVRKAGDTMTGPLVVNADTTVGGDLRVTKTGSKIICAAGGFAARTMFTSETSNCALSFTPSATGTGVTLQFHEINDMTNSPFGTLVADATSFRIGSQTRGTGVCRDFRLLTTAATNAITISGTKNETTFGTRLFVTAGSTTVPSIGATGAASGLTFGATSMNFTDGTADRVLFACGATSTVQTIRTTSNAPAAECNFRAETANSFVSLQTTEAGFARANASATQGFVLGTVAGSGGVFLSPNGSTSFAVLPDGKCGIGLIAPAHQLDVNGDAYIRGPLDVVGNITATGTAHSFAANSIPSTAVIGNIPRTIAATGSAGSSGQMVWDDNFIYLRTTSGWKKVALTAI